MIIDIILVGLYLLIHFSVISVAVLFGLVLYYFTEWLLDKLTSQNSESLSDHYK